ncbi:coproporphyrinogen-III oxidase family protein [Psychrilyobacter atlanticus]|uniref:coproporphyrinogen-III oxidase family protein n=1 Tax=Psychrilyobacter atlanticus TaxID=271091 RepID=UPI000418FD34|nr:radical SAM protein [Psychrilyobacter atlanticus]
MLLTNILKLILTRRWNPFIFYKPQKEVELKYNSGEIGLYIHIPFCKSICSFCPYFKVLYNEDLANFFINALIKEIKIVSERYPKKITSIYFGGGTPALLIEKLGNVVTEIRNSFDVENNFAIELHPDNLENEILSQLKENGFNMISIGVQSFSENCLKNLGRDKENIEEKLERVRKFQFDVVDVDLIFGIPGQTEDDLEYDFDKAVELGATQISTYPFIDFSYSKNKNKPLGRSQKKKMLNRLSEVSEKNNFERTSVWTFAKKGSSKYSSVTRDSFIGLGPSAASLADNFFKVNTFSVEEYIKSIEMGKNPTCLVMKFDFRTRAAYWLFWSCYNIEINSDSFNELFNETLAEKYSWELKILEKLRFLEKYPTGYRLTERGAYYFHLVEQKYTHQYIDKTWRMALENPWPEKIELY